MGLHHPTTLPGLIAPFPCWHIAGGPLRIFYIPCCCLRIAFAFIPLNSTTGGSLLPPDGSLGHTFPYPTWTRRYRTLTPAHAYTYRFLHAPFGSQNFYLLWCHLAIMSNSVARWTVHTHITLHGSCRRGTHPTTPWFFGSPPTPNPLPPPVGGRTFSVKF